MCWRSITPVAAAALQNRTTPSNTDELPQVLYMPQLHSTGLEYQFAPGSFSRVRGYSGAFSDGAQMESRPCLLRISNFSLWHLWVSRTVWVWDCPHPLWKWGEMGAGSLCSHRCSGILVSLLSSLRCSWKTEVFILFHWAALALGWALSLNILKKHINKNEVIFFNLCLIHHPQGCAHDTHRDCNALLPFTYSPCAWS